MKNLLNTKVKDMKAITLIALVITIVVLIILATVVINLSLGQNGLFNKAKYASQSYKNAQDYEEEEIANYNNEIDQYASLTRAGGSNINYSTAEQDTGLKWINNKPIYQITISPSGSYGSGVHTVLSNIVDTYNIDEVINIDAIMCTAAGPNTKKTIIKVSNAACDSRDDNIDACYIDQGNLMFYKCSTGAVWHLNVTIQYTKTVNQ